MQGVVQGLGCGAVVLALCAFAAVGAGVVRGFRVGVGRGGDCLRVVPWCCACSSMGPAGPAGQVAQVSALRGGVKLHHPEC